MTKQSESNRHGRSHRGQSRGIRTIGALAILVSLASTIALAQSASDTNPVNDAERFPGQARLQSDRGLRLQLKRADQHFANNEQAQAFRIWQDLLDHPKDLLVIDDSTTSPTSKLEYVRYQTLSRMIEQTLAGLEQPSLRTYRATAGGQAQAMLVTGNNRRRIDVLRQVVQQYFMSASGDEAAFELSVRHLDEADYLASSRLLLKLLNDYPSSSVPRRRILLRLAVADARLGDLDSARRHLNQSWQSAAANGNGRAARAVERDLIRFDQHSPLQTTAAQKWQMRLGNSSQSGHMPTPPADSAAPQVARQWSQLLGRKPSPIVADEDASNSVADIPKNPWSINSVRPDWLAGSSIGIRKMTARWKSTGRKPCGQLVFDFDRVYFKNDVCLVCCDAATGRELWHAIDDNQFQLAPLSQFYMSRLRDRRLSTSREVRLLGNQVHAAMSIVGDAVYSLEGDLLLQGVSENKTPRSTSRRRGTPRSSGILRLAAYETRTGRLRWSRLASDERRASKFDSGFLAAPVGHADRLLVPVIDRGGIWLYALAKHDGSTIWKKLLCDEPDGGCSPWSPVGISVADNDVYVATGAGMVLALDANSGRFHWAVRYQRTGRPGLKTPVRQPVNIFDLDGWDEDTVIAHGKWLIVCASDCNHAFALDRRTGQLLWDTPKQPAGAANSAEYCLGIKSDGWYVAGKNMLARYKLRTGESVWQKSIPDSHGRGALTNDVLLMPVGESVVRFDLESGDELKSSRLVAPSDSPIGNLYSDGSRLFAVGIHQVSVLASLTNQLETLAGRIKDRDGHAQLERMQLRVRLGDPDGAIDDLKAAFTLLLRQENPVASIRSLYAGIGELALADTRPQLALELIASIEESIRGSKKSTAAVPPDLIPQRDAMLIAALKVIHEKQLKGAAPTVLRIVGLCHAEHLLIAARRAMAATARTGDVALLRAALKNRQYQTRVVATAGLSVALSQTMGDALLQLLKDDEPSVRLAAAVALANRGDRAALTALGKLLESKSLRIRIDAVGTLRSVTSTRFDFNPYDDDDSRDISVTPWHVWIGEHGTTAKLKTLATIPASFFGRTLVCYGKRIAEFNSQGQQTWSVNLTGARDCEGLPNGHRLVASASQNRVTEYNATGGVVWINAKLPKGVSSVQRLPNGNTLVACSIGGRLLELDSRGQVHWQIPLHLRPTSARRVANGRTLVVLQHVKQVVEVNSSGKIERRFAVVGNPVAAERLEDGNTLVCVGGSNGELIEFDRDGKSIWTQRGFSYPNNAQRLANGNTLVSDRTGITVIDHTGNQVWHKADSGIVKVHRY